MTSNDARADALRQLASTALLLSFAAPAHAQLGPRYAVVIQAAEGTPASAASTAEQALVEALLAKSFVLIDEKQSQKIRNVTDVGRLIEGVIPDVITPLDADRIIVG